MVVVSKPKLERRKRDISNVPRARRLLAFIVEFKELNDYSPDVREMGNAVGIPSTSVVNYYLQKLIERDLIKVEPYKARTVRLTEEGKALVKSFLQKRRKDDGEPFCAIEVNPATSEITFR